MEMPVYNLLQQRDAYYTQIVHLYERLLEVTYKDEWTEEVNLFNSLLDESATIQKMIDEINDQLTSLGSEHEDLEKYNESARSSLGKVIEIKALLEQALAKEFQSLSKSMKSVKNQQVILNAYYGVRRKEYTPIYFDEKK